MEKRDNGLPGGPATPPACQRFSPSWVSDLRNSTYFPVPECYHALCAPSCPAPQLCDRCRRGLLWAGRPRGLSKRFPEKNLAPPLLILKLTLSENLKSRSAVDWSRMSCKCHKIL